MKLLEVYQVILGSKQKIKILLFFLCILLNGILELLNVSVMLPLVIAILNPRGFQKFQFLYDYLPNSVSQNQEGFTTFLLMVLFFVVVVKNIFIYLTKIYQRKFVVNGCYNTSRRLFNVYLHCDYEELINKSSNEIINNIVNVTNKIYLFLAAFLDLAAEIVVTFFLFIFLLTVNWQITLVLSSLLVGLQCLFRRYTDKQLRLIGAASNKVYANVLKSIQEAIGAYKEIKVFGKEREFYNSFCDNYRQNVFLEYKKAFYEIAPAHITETTVFLVLCFYVWVAISNNLDRSDVVAELATISLAAVRMIPAMNRINRNWGLINLYVPSLKLISGEFIRYAGDDLGYDFAIAEQFLFKGKVELRDVSYRYKNTSCNVLEHVNLEIAKGQKIGIQGVSGGGKTTLVDIILGYLQPQSGEILVDGVSIAVNYPGWMQNIAYIPQRIYLLNGTIRDNVLFGSDEYDESKFWRVLEQAQILDFVKNLKQGIDTMVGECGIKLSGGQRQRLGIARALYHESEILVFDEATASLDKGTAKELMKAIGELGKNKTILMISHDIETLEICDVVYIVKDKGLERIR